MVAAGYRAIESLRLEKGYRVWAGDLTPETTPDEAGLGFCVKPGKPGGFLGREALLKLREDGGPARTLACLTLDDPREVALGSEPVRVDGAVAGRVTSAGFGWTVGRSIAYAYLPVPLAAAGTAVTVELFGRQVPGVVAPSVLYDPTSARVRA
jgi:4-methylaminobutanoate oxidase (formaldehyde-forming)